MRMTDKEYKAFLRAHFGIDVPIGLTWEMFSHRNQAATYLEIPPKKYKAHNKREWWFRGDDRSPVEIFEKGFSPRVPCRLPIWRCAESDVHPHSTVCLSRSFLGAATFPLINATRPLYDQSWIYMIWVDGDVEYFNTQRMQVRGAASFLAGGGGSGAVAAALMGVGEVAKQYVSPGRIVSAVRVARRWRSTDWTQLGFFQIKDLFGYVPNKRFAGPQDRVTVALRNYRDVSKAWQRMSITGNAANAAQMRRKYDLIVLTRSAEASRAAAALPDVEDMDYGIFGNLDWLPKSD